ncbi:DNA circularization protein [Fodinicurvata fenggangensis]|uniref:DNA circularization protein n=1 Tax=Fodinicurvata fenggangensis TaxID=1121830 RepID=UPI00047DF09A|nr:DNA circularization N-terminal domain-containing protein [Fodinicurvata fenggangensis]
MSWRERLRPGSFRGVGFHLDADDRPAGRRAQVHEYPQRDEPYTEDLGRQTRRFRISAYLLGPDYDQELQALIEALDQAGPGTLVHPFYGELQVVCLGDGTRISHDRREGGYCRITMSFVEAGALRYPEGQVNSRVQTRSSADLLDQAALADFAATFDVTAWPDYVRDAATGLADELSSFISDGFMAAPLELTGLLSSFVSSATGALSAPMDLGRAVQGLVGDAAGLMDSGDRLEPLLDLGRFSGSGGPTYFDTPARRAQADNARAFSGLTRRAALAEAARATADMEWEVLDDALSARERIGGGLDTEAQRPEVSDRTFRALTELRTTTVRDITRRAASVPQLRTVRPNAPMPALVLAYDLFEDAGRESEIVTRNRIRHPGYLPAEELAVLER